MIYALNRLQDHQDWKTVSDWLCAERDHLVESSLGTDELPLMRRMQGAALTLGRLIEISQKAAEYLNGLRKHNPENR